SHRLLALARWDLHFMRLRLRNFLTRKHAAMRKRAASARPMYLNLGSGPRGIDDLHWINVDGYPDKNVDFLLDFTRPLPFADECHDGVFCEHVFEHFTHERKAWHWRQATKWMEISVHSRASGNPEPRAGSPLSRGRA